MENLQELSNKFVFTENDFEDINLKPEAVLQQFQNIALEHAKLLGLGFSEMIKKNLLWIVMRIKYEIIRLPKPDELLTIITYPQAKNFLEFDRDFLIKDIHNNIIIKGTSKWCLLDKTTRHLAKMTSIDYPFQLNKQPAFDGKFLKTETIIPNFAPDYSYKVLADDIDQNNHMNNTVYSKLTLSALRLKNEKITSFQINFLKEAVLGDRIDVYKKTEEDGYNLLGKLCEKENSFSAYIKTKKI